MSFARNPNQDALERELGATRPGVSHTMPVREDAPATGPWNKGQIVGAARQGADFNRLGGGFGNADTDSIKHTFGRIAQNFDTSDAGLQALVNDPEFKQFFPKASLSKDWIDFGGQLDPHTGTNVGKVDVQRGWVQGGQGGPWQWLTEAEALGGGNPMAAGGAGGPMAPAMPGQSDLMAMILASLQGEQQPIDSQALLLESLR